MYRGGGVSARLGQRPANGVSCGALQFLALLPLMALLVASAAAQQPAQPPASSDQQPGQGAQLHTGTSSGLSLDIRIQNLLADHQYFRVQSQLGELPPDLAELYRGILANRSNNLRTSIRILEPLLAQMTTAGKSATWWDVAHEKLLREALAEDYLRSGDWPKADAAYSALELRLSGHLSAEEQDSIELPVKLLPLAKDNPPTTVDPCGPFTIQGGKDPLGLLDIPVFVDADSKSWMLDPTAPFNLIDSATARQVGLKVSEQAATIRTLTGRPIQVHMAIVPRFTIGGQLTLNNMTVFVYDDADYFFPYTGYHVEGVLGYPALAAMGSITVTNDDMVKVNPARQIGAVEKSDLLTIGAPFFLDGNRVIVALAQTAVAAATTTAGPAAADPASDTHADDRMFAVDAGGQQTYLTSRYFDEHATEFNGQQLTTFSFPGLQPGPQPAYEAETVPLTVGSTTVDVHYLHVLTKPLGSAALDDIYGVLGVDALQQLGSYTFDYRTMRFSVQPE